jgi:hypothetical protein
MLRGFPTLAENGLDEGQPFLMPKTIFLEEGEQVQPRGCGTTIESLPQPWDWVDVFLKKYITCEGRYML